MEFGGGAAPVWVLRLTAERGMTATQVLIVAIDRMAREYADSGVVEVAPAVGELIGPGTPGGRIDKNVTRGFTDCRADLFRGCAGLLYAISVHPAPQEPAGSGWRVFFASARPWTSHPCACLPCLPGGGATLGWRHTGCTGAAPCGG